MGAPFGQLPRSETKRFVNEETGEELYIPFINGKPIYPIPAGFKQAEVIKKEAEEKDPTRATVDTTRVTDSGDDSQQEPDTKEYRVASTLAKDKRNPITDAIGSLFKAGPIGIALDKIRGPETTPSFDKASGLFDEEIDQAPNKNDVLALQAGYTSYEELATKLGVAEPKFEFGTAKGTIDRDTGKFFTQYGQAEDINTGQVSYTSFTDFVNAMSASAKTGYYGGVESAKDALMKDPTNTKAQNFLKEMGETYKVDEPSVATGDERVEDTQEYKDDIRDDEPVYEDTDDTTEPESTVGDDSYDDSTDDGGGFDSNTGGGGSDDYGSMFKQGGLAGKKKKKKVKKKRGGLASRK